MVNNTEIYLWIPDEGKPKAYESYPACYAQQNNHGGIMMNIILVKQRFRLTMPCSVEGCERPSIAKGFCQAHYHQNYAKLRRGKKDLTDE